MWEVTATDGKRQEAVEATEELQISRLEYRTNDESKQMRHIKKTYLC